MKKDFQGFNHGKGQIDLSKYPISTEMKPIEIHLKEDGSLDDKPSLTIVLARPKTNYVYGQISLQMLNEGLADIGYEIKKIKE